MDWTSSACWSVCTLRGAFTDGPLHRAAWYFGAVLGTVVPDLPDVDGYGSPLQGGMKVADGYGPLFGVG